MTTLLGDARVRIRADWSAFTKDLNGKEINRVGAKAGKDNADAFSKAQATQLKRSQSKVSSLIGDGFKDIAKGFTIVAAGATVVSFFKDSIRAASDLNETTSKAGVIFGKSSKDIEKWASTAATSFGLSRQQALDAAASFGDMFLQLGFTQDQAVKTSKSTVQLAADLGSFSNVDPSDVLERIKAAYRGEYDSLQLLIPNISAARVEQEALRMTHKDSVKDLTAADKAMAVNAIITKDGSRAAGDFARTSGGLANQQRIMAAQFEDTKAKLGQGLLPVMAGVAKVMNTGVLPAFNGLIDFLTHIPGPMYGAIAAFVAGRIAITLFGKAAEKVSAKGGIGASFKSGLQGIMGIMGGPWGLAFAGATTILGYFLSKQAEGKQRVEELSQTLDKQTGAVTDSTRAYIANQLQQNGTIDKAEALHLNLGLVTDAAMGSGDAMNQLKGILIPLSKQMEFVRDANGQMTFQQTAGAKAATELLDSLTGQSAELADATKQQKQLAQATASSNSSLNTNNELTKASAELTSRKKAVSDTLDKALKALNDSLQASNNQFLIMRGSENAVYAAMDDLTAAVKTNGRTLDVHTAKGRANRAALDQVATASLSYLSSLSDHVKQSPKFVGIMNTQRNKLITAAEKFGLSKKAAKEYAGQILDVPTKLSTSVNTPGLAAAKKAIRNLEVQIEALKNKSLYVRIDSKGNAILREKSALSEHAAGGLITGPGTGTSDSIVARLSDGEFVTNARATKMFRPLLEHINGYAGGGVVKRKINVNTSAHMPKKLASDIMSQIDPMAVLGMGGGTYGAAGPAGGAKRWAGVILTALRMLGQSASWLGVVESRMNRESGGNPNAINLWDSNARAGYPSQGLMQTIPGTFAAYAGSLRSRGIRDPLANTYAGLNYALHRYGTLAALSRPGGYANGTKNATAGWHWVGENGRELVRMKGGESVTPESKMGGITVQVFIGDRELTELVDVRVQHNNSQMADQLRRGRR